MGRVESGLSMARGRSELERKEAEETIARGQTLERINVRNEYFFSWKNTSLRQLQLFVNTCKWL